MRRPLGVSIFITIMLLLDTYVFQAVKLISRSASPTATTIIYACYWGLTLFALTGFLLFVYTGPEFLGKKLRTYLFAIVIGLFLAKLLAVIFLLVDDIRRVIQWVAMQLHFYHLAADGFGRSYLVSWLGVSAGGLLFLSLLLGFTNKYNYQVKRLRLTFANLPAAFRGLKLIHISDIHSGSLADKKAVMQGVQKILDENADLILFTGDLVNDRASEMGSYMDVFGRLNAPMGVFSTFGNHDYGDYVTWPHNGITKTQNLEGLKKVHEDLGWRLLMNEHVVLERNGERIALLGIENWSSKARFPKHGRMDQAHPGTEQYPFKILMSHDPSHWDAEVKTKYTDIDLMLSGHTHGMQFGIDLPWFKWSPVQYMYRQWAGLYEHGQQKLYVNRGYGFLGYPGRVGVMPEITVIELV